MTSRTHDAIAFASLLTVAAYMPLPRMSFLTILGAVIAADIGSAIPDIDTAGNRLWELLPQGRFVGRILRNIFYKHRTVTHSLIGLYVMYTFFAWLVPTIVNTDTVNGHILLSAIMIGIVSHIVADSLTEEGVPLFFPLRFPFGIPPVRALRMKTGRWFEHLVVFPSVILYMVWLVITHENTFRGIFRIAGG